MLQHLTFRIFAILQNKNEFFFYSYDKGHSLHAVNKLICLLLDLMMLSGFGEFFSSDTLKSIGMSFEHGGL